MRQDFLEKDIQDKLLLEKQHDNSPEAYLYAVGRGIKHMITSPVQLYADAQIITAHYTGGGVLDSSDYASSSINISNILEKHPELYREAEQRMLARWEGVKSVAHFAADASALANGSEQEYLFTQNAAYWQAQARMNQRVEGLISYWHQATWPQLVEAVTPYLLPAVSTWSYFKINTMIQRHKTMGVWFKPPVFKNLEPTISGPANVRGWRLTAKDIHDSTGDLEVIWALTPDGKMHYGKRRYKGDPFHHSDLVDGAPVIAGGELETWNGRLLQAPNNKTGHYRARGPASEKAAVSAFQRDGFSVYDIEHYTYRNNFVPISEDLFHTKIFEINRTPHFGKKDFKEFRKFGVAAIHDKPTISQMTLLKRAVERFGRSNIYQDAFTLTPWVEKYFNQLKKQGLLLNSAMVAPSVTRNSIFDTNNSYLNEKTDMRQDQVTKESLLQPIKNFMNTSFNGLLQGDDQSIDELDELKYENLRVDATEFEEPLLQEDPGHHSVVEKMTLLGIVVNTELLKHLVMAEAKTRVQLNMILDAALLQTKQPEKKEFQNAELLQYLAISQARAQTQLDMISDFVQEQKYQETKRKFHANIMRGAELGVALGKQFNSRSLTQFSQVVGGAEQIRVAYNELKGMKKLMSLDSFGEMASIGTAILSIIGCFAKSGPNPNAILLENIQAVAQQVYDLRIEMHQFREEMEEWLGKIYQDMMSSFCELRLETHTIKNLIETLRHEVAAMHIDLRESLSTLNIRLNALSQRTTNAERKRLIDEMYVNSNTVLSVHAINSKEFVRLFNLLKSEITTLSPTNSFLVGESGDLANTVKQYENDSRNEFFSDFHIFTLTQYLQNINAMEAERFFISNPTIWCFEVMTLMLLLKRRYALTPDAEDRIAKTELQELKVVFSQGEKLKNLLNFLKTQPLLTTLCDRYLKSGNELVAVLQRYLTDQEAQFTQRIDAAWRTTIDAFDEGLIELFKQQENKIALNAKQHPNWFRGYSKNFHANFPQGDGPFPFSGQGDHPHTQKLMEKYLEKQQKQIATQLNALADKMRTPLAHARLDGKMISGGSYHIFSLSRLKTTLHSGMLFPRVETQPILALHINKGELNPEIAESLWYNLRNLRFYYRIENKKFILEMVLTQPRKETLLRSFSTDYTPGIYTEENEAIWWFWNGGNYCKDGKTHIFESNDGVTSEGNTWHNYGYNPTCTENPGCRETMIPQEVTQLPANSPVFNEIRQEIADYKAKKIAEVATDLHEKLNREDASPLAKAMIQYSYDFYMLQNALKLAFYDHRSMQEAPLLFFSNEASQLTDQAGQPLLLLRHRSDFCNYLKNIAEKPQNKSFCEDLKQNLTYFEQEVKGFIIGLSQSEGFHYSLLEKVLNEFSDMLQKYEANAVDENRLAHSMQTEERLQKENEFLYSLLRSVGAAIASENNQELQKRIHDQVAKATQNQQGSGFSAAFFRRALPPANTDGESAALQAKR